MNNINNIGNSHHQKILSQLVTLFSHYPNIKMFGIYGSLATGAWDTYSDYDLEVIIESNDAEEIARYVELIKDLLSKNEREVSICNYEGDGKWALVLENLDRINITFHTADYIKPYVLDSLVILSGGMNKDDLSASLSQKELPINLLTFLHNRFFDLAINVEVAIQRKEPITAINELHELRALLMNIYLASRDLQLTNKIDRILSAEMKQTLSLTYPQLDLEDIKKCFDLLVDTYIEKLSFISNNKIKPDERYKIIAEKIKTY
ncbi:MAG: nucleotidyltransferase domain-containing protein [Microgenomates group bacterium]